MPRPSLPSAGGHTISPLAAPDEKRTTITLDGPLTRMQLEAIADGAQVALSDAARARIDATQTTFERWLAEGRDIYGASSGVGDLRDVGIAHDEQAQLQLNIVRSHGCGIGHPLPPRLVRAALALRAAALARGHSAVRSALVEHLLAMLNAKVHPLVPSRGSVGASGDPVLLAHLALAVVGEGSAQLGDGAPLPAAEALARRHLEPIVLEGREGLALVNGLDFTIAAAAMTHSRAERLLEWADAIAALTLDALGASHDPFAPDVQHLRGRGRHCSVAARIARWRSGARPHHDAGPQDPYCLRCIPQIHGASWTALDRHAATVDHELSAVIDNPLVLPDAGAIRHCGHFHGQELGLTADHLAQGLTSLANVVQARLSLLLRGARGLPRMLCPQPGARCGLMMLETTGAALVARMRAMAAPLSIHSLAVSADQEDHTSMAWEAVRRTDELLSDLSTVIAAEAIAAAQALHLRGSRVTLLRGAVDTLAGSIEEDRPLGPDLQRVGTALLEQRPPPPP